MIIKLLTQLAELIEDALLSMANLSKSSGRMNFKKSFDLTFNIRLFDPFQIDGGCDCMALDIYSPIQPRPISAYR